jgi:putative peptide zinc metalloprotease protein
MSQQILLPPLREDLSLLRGPLAEGVPTWTVYDPAQRRYLRLDWLDFEILRRWGLQTPDAIVSALRGETTLRATESDVLRFAEFARRANLLRATSAMDTKLLAQEIGARRHSPFMWLVHNYLFVRLRLVNPDRFLAALLPFVRGAFSPGGVAALLLLCAFGLFLISREWEIYTHSLVEQFTVEGLVGMGVALSFSKVFHELGHGLAAKRYGCRVPSMGVAFLVLWPVLWTDTTDAWRLPDRRQRLVIDVAGVAAEIAVAAIASIAWAVLPDGPMRSAVFVLSSTTWLLTVSVNAVPLLRFDGYYVLSDLLDIANLQERGFAYTRWWLRELLFRPGVPAPEPATAARARHFIVYSLASWTYRLFVFGGIAVLVYHVSFKALGIVLAAIEVWFFLARPIVRELTVWARIATSRRPNLRTLATLSVCAVLVASLFVPWHGRVDAPGLLRSEQQLDLLAAEPGRLVAMARENSRVAKGEVLFRLESVDIERAFKVAAAQLEAAQAGLSTGAFDTDRRRAQQTSYAKVSEATAALLKAQTRAASLLVRAPFAGEIRDIPASLRLGDDIRRREALGVLVSPQSSIVEAYVAEADLDRVAPGAKATLLLLDGTSLPLVVSDVDHASTRQLEVQELASIHDGPIPVRRGSSNVLVPDRTIYRVLLVRDDDGQASPVPTRLVGRVVIEAPKRSAAAAIYRRVVALAMRESSL